MSSQSWVVVYTKANQEAVAIENLKRQSFDVYCPTIIRMRKHARKVDHVQRPIFPSYVFVRYQSLSNKWSSLMATRGVRSLVKFGERISLLPENVVSEMRQCEQAGVFQEAVKPKINPGDSVTVVEGPFQNFMAKVLSVPEKDRIWVLLDMMGHKVKVSQNLASLDLVKTHR